MEFDPSFLAGGGDDFQEQLQSEYQTTKTTLTEITATLGQSQFELNRLMQVKANVTAQLQNFSGDSDTISKADIRNSFNSAMEAQQRLLVMRGQLDKLMEQKNALEKYKTLIEGMLDYLQGKTVSATPAVEDVGGASSLEMLITSQEAERQRLSRQMHDGPAQALSNLIVQSEIASRMYEIEPDKVKEELDKLKISAMGTFQKIRSFIAELRPMMLDDLGLVPTLKRYVGNLKEQTGADITLTINGTYRRLKPYIEVYIFRAMQEVISNAIKHNLDNVSQIKIDVTLNIESNSIMAAIKDNGKGFEPKEIHSGSGLGLKLIKERATLLGGSIDISSSESKGTEVILKIPVEDEPAAVQ